ncbi:MAG: ATP-binding protein, partial [Rubrobacter sp.]
VLKETSSPKSYEDYVRDALERLFERFYRVEKSRSRGEAHGGSGVGLAISRALVEAMGGRIRAESPGPGEGATFAFTLPVYRPRS